MVGLPQSEDPDRPRAALSIGPGGLAPVVILAAVFAAFGAKVGAPVAMAAVLGAVGGTASLLVHELGHVRAARRSAGIQSAAVSLIWFGAATRLEGRYTSGREQVRVAIAGPRASFAFAIALLPSLFLPMPLVVKELVLILVLFNVAIGALNLVPAYPLDGHKLVVGLLWCLTGSEKRARRIIRRIGFGWVAIELPSAALLLFQKPSLGLAAVVMAGGAFAQKRFARSQASS
jgi:Zn-dependent protease